ncbi:mechanosensitive ion channel family protein [Aphanothece sacrum]|uniref:Mechanosensitive ion channel protein n=1 Tax=Aphanothece sacrum FPU1 TaxID=1920663 RepID=A0A401IKW0_APHSA|nr:mechanosensitive ion channel domain-containing protein [Aphanothece sacrum]GBF81881.1 mechanosensitive ion channel protein [Aphanothece sacrum FPU1]GBF83510.1 mechanosensitive ion channel protein [Aphanothece sacrum FPU3]
METNLILDVSYFWEEWLKITIVLQRPAVQVQLLAIALSIILVWFISRWLWYQFCQRFPKSSQFCQQNSQLYWQQCGAALFHYLIPPLLCLLIVNLLKIVFFHQGLFLGYLTDSIKLLGIYCFYRIFLIFLYTLFDRVKVKYYHHRFFAPLFFIFILTKIINIFTNLETLSQISLIKLFGDSVTLATVFITLGGLYFWIVGCLLLEELLFCIFSFKINNNPKIIQAISLILRYFLIGLGIVLIFGYVGVSSTAIAAITGGLSVGIGFGLKEVISNFVSGIWLLFEGALKPEDIISIDNEMSQVKKLGIRATTVQVIRDNSEKIIPNQVFFIQDITTFTGSNSLICCSLIVGASYQCNPDRVLGILLKVADSNEKILKSPNPIAFAINFGESSIDFELRFWIDNPLSKKIVTSNLICEIWQTFKENNIEIPYPQRDLHIRNGTQENNSEFLERT